MVKAETRYWVDLISLLTFIVNAISGYILWLVLPRGGGGWRGGGERIFLGLIRNNWIAIYDWSSLIFTIAITIHFMINFTWVVQMTKKILI